MENKIITKRAARRVEGGWVKVKIKKKPSMWWGVLPDLWFGKTIPFVQLHWFNFYLEIEFKKLTAQSGEEKGEVNEKGIR